MASRNTRSDKLDLRIEPSVKRTLRAAAEARHQSVSDFVVGSALREAEEVLMDRRRFELSAEDWAAFQAALDAPARVVPELQRLFREPSPFDSPKPE